MSAEPLVGGVTGGPRRARTALTPVRAIPPPPSTVAFPADEPATRSFAVVPPPPSDSSPDPARPEPATPPAGPTVAPGRNHGSGPAPSPAPSPVPRTGPDPRRGPDPRAGSDLRTRPVPGQEPAATAPTETRVAGVVRDSWAQVEPRIDEVADWFAALLFSLAPTTRALFPARVTPSARRLLRSLLLPMTTLDRPAELRGALEPLVSEHRGLGLAPEQYEAIGVALVGAMRRYATEGWDATVERDWVQAFALVAGPLEDVLAAQRGPAVVTASVVEHRRIGWDLATVTLVPHAPVAYRAGQHVPVEIPARPRMWRQLSPACAPRADGALEFHVKAVEGGWVSRAMVAHTRVGDTWHIGPARGRLELDPESPRDVLMVAGGTGAAPMLALCEDLATRPDPPGVTVLMGGRTPDDLYAWDRFADLESRHDWLAVGGVSEDDALSHDTIPGRLPEVVVRCGDLSEHDILLAGSPGMIRATVSALLVEGIGLDRIRYDPFTD